jgi:ribosomal protein S18 acetylase RimI-like enzyme
LGGEDAITAIELDSVDPPVTLYLERLVPHHAPDVARLHFDAQRGTFLSALGPDILQIVYEKLPATEFGFGFAITAPASGDGLRVPVGFVSATTSVGGLFVRTGLTSAGRLAPRLLVRYLRSPVLIGHTFQTALYPLISQGGDEDVAGSNACEDSSGGAQVSKAELLSIMVEDHWRGRGLGAMLVDALVAECAARDIAYLDVTVDSMNDGARRFYERYGFVLHRTFRLYGREMCGYGRQIQARGA